ncbi:tetratricopeptide repeat-containing sensor histidine kinase [Flavihumibacter fluvii]|uniref:tetratricopeptide repeat-containing sensor histidine kinase n=1 Tax=Flavihumibacter fluvii TaxID=2838157 RepID=UPI001BDE3CCB|nr:ATP-binding protein [Flavihumibacter fluvii]ULQ50917.1 ATP-binding protein [Flavihumibacter fluvii]
MIKSIAFFLVFTLTWSIGTSQPRHTMDSLHQQLAMAKEDTSRVKALILLCYNYRLGFSDSSLYYGQQALELSQKIKYPAGELRSLQYMSITQEQMGNLPKALEMAFKALEIAKEHHLENLAGGALNALGETYIILKDFPKAVKYLTQQRILGEALGFEEAIGYAMYDLGYAFEEMNQLDSATYYEKEAIKHFDKISRKEPIIYKVLGDVEMKSGNQAAALQYYQESLRISIANNERRATAYAYNKIASFYNTVKQTDSAIYYARKGLESATLIEQRKSIMEAAALLSTLYEPTDTRESLRYLKIADAYKDSLFGTGNLQAVQALVANEEDRQKEMAATKVAYQNRLQQYVLIAGLAMLLIVAFFLYRNSQKEKKAKNLLQHKNMVIEQTLNNLKATQSQLIQSEKMASLGELTAGIAHEIQNPLNFVNNFSEVNKELLAEMKDEIDKGNLAEAKSIAEDIIGNQEKINHHGKRADAIVKGMLQHSQSSSGVKELTDINALAEEYLRLAYHGIKAKDKSFNASLKTNYDDTICNINIIPPEIGRVILNLVNNAFYAVAEKARTNIQGYEPTVSLSTSKRGDKIFISVEDNGNGVPKKVLDKIFQPFFTTKPTGQGTGLGLSLSYDIVKAHGGELKVDTKDNESSVFTVELPL